MKTIFILVPGLARLQTKTHISFSLPLTPSLVLQPPSSKSESANTNSAESTPVVILTHSSLPHVHTIFKCMLLQDYYSLVPEEEKYVKIQ
mmetsp:Transcript_3318/g.6493  ORF Transcript_3318/g.6493 Transcript_3318/m.6493 type:complete len:90 (-) Transcript_3318:2062-2331(-)